MKIKIIPMFIALTSNLYFTVVLNTGYGLLDIASEISIRALITYLLYTLFIMMSNQVRSYMDN